MQDQNYKNHSRLVPLYHYGVYLLVTLVIVGSIIKFYKSYTYNMHGLLTPVLFFLVGITLLLLTWYTRFFALKAQDRAIRSEENLRYFAITGNLLDSKLTMGQIVALRFAPNNEFVDLAHRAVSEDMKPSDIKKAIQNWKADHSRV
ncbi:MAG: DUF6526 family protein [Ferruginibacter sp.]